MKKGKWVVKKVPATTNNTTTAIINFLLSKGHSASRVNVQGQWDEKKQLWRPSGSRKGFFDIAACIFGRFVVLDTKTGDDELSEDQLKFQAEVRAAGGIAEEMETYQHFLDWYEKEYSGIVH